MDFSRINIITDSDLQSLKDYKYLENLVIKMGFNNEATWELPEIIKANYGGLKMWQYPNQFSKYLALLSQLNITSYIEIGCRWGGTFVLTNEYLNRFNKIEKSVAVDIIDSPVVEYCLTKREAQFIKINSQSEQFKNYMQNNYFDLIFIDGDHSYNGVKKDYEVCKKSGRIFIFHDITNDTVPGVGKFWQEIKKNEGDIYDFFEYTEQYMEVTKLNKGAVYLGIGVAIKK